MAPSGWYSRVIDLINSSIGNKQILKSQSCLKKNVLATGDGVIYMWLDAEHAILSVDVNRICSVTDKSDQIVDYAKRVLVPSSPPCYEITSLVLEETTGQRIALVGSHGVNVVQIPQHNRSKGNQKTLCSSVEIGERFFINSPQCDVLEVKWHPGSPTHSHLLILFSNNTLRIYDSTANAGTSVQVYNLGPSPVFRLNSSAGSSFARVLGDTAVDFDFGRPCLREGKCQKLWPLYVLRGNGDVYVMWIPEPHLHDMRCELKGPLSMHPPAEDNYGVDACSLLCLSSEPPVLVIATTYGMIYHCVALEDDKQSDNESDDDETVSNFPSTSVSLYVYESLELDLSNSPRENGEDDEGSDTESVKRNDSITPIRIFKDNSTLTRYYCCHSSGIHTVALPLVAQLQTFAEALTGEDRTDLLSTLNDQTCIVEHMVCTKPLSSSVSTPVIGLVVISGVAFGGTTLLCLLANFELLTIPLVPTYLESLPRLLFSQQSPSTSNNSSQVTKEPFDHYIRRILQRRNSNPIYKSEVSSPEPLLKDCLNLLNKSTRILREEYIQKLDLAHETIIERVKVLRELQAQQWDEIGQLDANKDKLTNRAEYLKERYKQLQERQEAIVKRVENVLGGLIKNAPVLSDAEQNMKKELLTIEERFKYLKNAMQKIRAKHDRQSTSVERSIFQKPRGVSSETNTMELKQIKEFLVEESNSITSLANQLKQIRLLLNL
ncbi:Nucleoporin 88kDa [Chamberlinius hualienensis]